MQFQILGKGGTHYIFGSDKGGTYIQILQKNLQKNIYKYGTLDQPSSSRESRMGILFQILYLALLFIQCW
jgi:hypothetical protein